MPKPRTTYELIVRLLHVEPVVWRRLLVPSGITLPKLHEALQIVLGWQNYHLHCYVVDGLRIGPVDPDFEDGTIDERRKRLSQFLNESRKRIRYEYDFGDGWEHEITLDDYFESDPWQPMPICIDGERSCPPEDVGGPPGYSHFLEAIRNESHPEHEELTDWIGGYFEPGLYDIHTANVLLGRRFPRDA